MFTTFPFLHHCGRNVRFTPENDFGSAKGILLRARSRPPRGGLPLKMIARSAGALGQASASPKGKVGFVAHLARGDLQCFVGDVEGKYFFLNIQHGFDPIVVLNYQFHFISVFRSLKATRSLIYHILLHARSLPRPRCSFAAGANLFGSSRAIIETSHLK